MEDKTRQERRPISQGEEPGPRTLAVLSAEELALRSQQGCQACFAELVQRYGGGLLTFMQQKTGHLQDAEDLVQDTFLKAYRNIHRYRNSFRFSTWLFTIGTRLASSRYRSRQCLKRCWAVRPDGSRQDAVASERQSNPPLWALAESLSRNQYEALWLRYAEDMSIKEIARVMGKSQVSVKVLLYRARMNLARRLNEAMVNDELRRQRLSKENVSSIKLEGDRCSAGSSD